MTDPDRMECVLQDPQNLIHDKRIGAMKDVLPILEYAVKEGRSMLVIAEDIEGDALATLVPGATEQGRGNAEPGMMRRPL